MVNKLGEAVALQVQITCSVLLQLTHQFKEIKIEIQVNTNTNTLESGKPCVYCLYWSVTLHCMNII